MLDMSTLARKTIELELNQEQIKQVGFALNTLDSLPLQHDKNNNSKYKHAVSNKYRWRWAGVLVLFIRGILNLSNSHFLTFSGIGGNIFFITAIVCFLLGWRVRPYRISKKDYLGFKQAIETTVASLKFADSDLEVSLINEVKNAIPNRPALPIWIALGSELLITFKAVEWENPTIMAVMLCNIDDGEYEYFYVDDFEELDKMTYEVASKLYERTV